MKIGRKSRKKNAFIEINRALSNLNKGSYVIDCGANVGEFTKLFLEKGFFVDAFEPDPIAINELKKKCKNNKNLNLFQSAVGLKDNTQKLFRYRKFDKNLNYFNSDLPFMLFGGSIQISSKIVGAISANLPSFNL